MLLRSNDLVQKNVTHIVIDETNCVVQWGDGFWEKFREIKLLRSLFPSATMLAFTTTTTIKMREKIAIHLAMKTHTKIAATLQRTNIIEGIQIVDRNKQWKNLSTSFSANCSRAPGILEKGASFPKKNVV